jgi:hypothetical protein
VSNKLQKLHSKELDRIRKAFIKNSHTRLLKSFSYHLPFGMKDAYVKEIMAADLDKLAGLIRICGFLMQTQIYSILTRKQGKKRTLRVTYLL